MEKNRIKLTGIIHKLFKLKTKAGGPMLKVLLQVGKDSFWVLSYGNVADAVGRLGEGDELAITGTAQMNNWKDDAGDWHNDFNSVAWSIEFDGQTISYEKGNRKANGAESRPQGKPTCPKQQKQHQGKERKTGQDLNQFDYQEGPF